jgi:hypothetical protein
MALEAQIMNGVLVVERSGDRKLTRNENVAATWVAQQSCHDDCVLKNNGCYAEMFRAGIHTHRLNGRASDLKMGLNKLRVKMAVAEARGIDKLTAPRKLRVHVVGDCATAETAGIVGRAMVRYVKRTGKAAWTYSHSWRRFGAKAWGGASVLASCERPEQVAQAKAKGYATALIVPDHPTNKVYNYKGVNVVPCPAQFKNPDGTFRVTCEDCNLCQNVDLLRARDLTIGFQPDLKMMKKKIYQLIGAE